MKKTLLLLGLILFMIGNVDASCIPNNWLCKYPNDCCAISGTSTQMYCWSSYSSSQLKCQNFKGEKGYLCTEKRDCKGELKCTYTGDLSDEQNNRRCAECTPGTSATDGVPNDPTTTSDDPADIVCNEVGQTCICMDDGVWSSKQYECGAACSSQNECNSGLQCITMPTGRKRCLSGVKNCCADTDCNRNYYCMSGVCTYVAPTTTLVGSTITTTTSTSTTTTTYPYQATTTTIVSPFNCDGYLVNISASKDDGYETTGNTWINNQGLKFEGAFSYPSSTIALTFRNIEVYNNIKDLKAKIWMKSKYVEDTLYQYEYQLGNTPRNINLADLSSSVKPSTIDTINQTLNFNESAVQGAVIAGADIPDSNVSAGTEYIVLDSQNDTWFPFNATVKVKTLLTYNWGSMKYGSNITLFLQLQNSPTQAEFYSFDDGAAYAPRLCIYDVTWYAPEEINACTVDEDCASGQYCETGFDYYGSCQERKEDYTITTLSDCFRNHECLSGKCSTHNENQIDYPTYNPYLDAYDIKNTGSCLPPEMKIDIAVVPSVVGLGINKTFEVFIHTSVNNSIFYPGCEIYYDPYIWNELFVPSNLSWAYTSEGYRFDTTHATQEISNSQYWTYKNKYTTYINYDIPAGSYRLGVKCRNWQEQYDQWKQLDVLVQNQNATSIIFLDEPETTQDINSEGLFKIKYTDFQDKPIYNAACLLEYQGTNYTMLKRGSSTDQYHERTIFFNETGTANVQIRCNKATYEQSYRSMSYIVSEDHCSNGVRDQGETGVDCGGTCIPCAAQNKTPDNRGCTSDGECINGYCNQLLHLCQTPTCTDGVKNNGESQIDCGGINCPTCSVCLYDSDCSNDGRQYCNSSYECQDQGTCATDNNCRVLRWFNPITGGTDQKPTYCDLTDTKCKFSWSGNENQTTKDLSIDISPLSGVMVNKSGTIFSVFNCDDDKNGFTIKTNKPTKITYTFVNSAYNPSIPLTYMPLKFGVDSTTSKTAQIPELCTSTKDIAGGFGVGQDSRYAKLNFKVCAGEKCNNQYIDVITFKHSLEKSLVVKLNPTKTGAGTTMYSINATNRTIQVWGKSASGSEWINLTTTHTPNAFLNVSSLTKDLQLLGSFYLLVNTSFNEQYIYRNTGSLPLLLTWDEDTQWFKLHEGIKLQGWMIYVVLLFIIVLVAYYNYKTQRARGEG